MRGSHLALVVAAGVVSALSIGAPAVADSDSSRSSDHQRIVDFWTNDKVSKAKPRDFEYDPGTGRFRPRKGSTSTSGTLGASWNGGGEVVGTTGKVLFAVGSSYYVCSASTTDDAVADRTLILTAGHCVFDNATGGFVTNWMFVPSYDTAPSGLDANGVFCATTTYGCWTASSLHVDSAFASQSSFNTTAALNDFAAVSVGAGGKSGTAQLDSTVGGHPLQFSPIPGGTTATLFGYPAAGRYKGKDLVYCKGAVGFDSGTGDGTYRVACNMTGGSSGGPWFAPFNTGSGTLVSVNSYGYSGVAAMYGPILNSKAEALFTSAASANGNAIIG